MSKFNFIQNGVAAGGVPIYDVQHAETGKHLGLVHITVLDGWVAYVRGERETGYRTRNAAAERLLLVSGVNPVAWSALPADPFDGVSA